MTTQLNQWRKHPLKKKWVCKPIDQLLNHPIVFYDLETDSKFGSYANLETCAVQYGLQGEPEMIETSEQEQKFREHLADPDVLKVDFNGVNYDQIVLRRHKYKFNEINSHDMFQAFKNIASQLPAFSQKFLSFYYLGDFHLPEMELMNWCQESGEPMHKAPYEILAAYNKWDITQLVNLFRIAWNNLIKPEYWSSYLDDILCGEPLSEMCLKGGEYLDHRLILKRAHKARIHLMHLNNAAERISKGRIANINSNAQLGLYLQKIERIELAISDSDAFVVDKRALMNIVGNSPIAKLALKVREVGKQVSYYDHYDDALNDKTFAKTAKYSWIPKQISLSSARTRRATSTSKYKINFQNIPAMIEEVQIIPRNKLYFRMDLDQVENVVHIFFSKDRVRRKAYENDPEWSEYVWLANEILGTNLDKKALEKIPSTLVPHWSAYKLFKSCKLGMNFGMGLDLYCEINGLSHDVGQESFARVQAACPAIKQLQDICRAELYSKGYVVDPFGKRYTGPARLAYKIVAYWVQGCGTGSLPKAIMRDMWDAGQYYGPKAATLNGTTHDDFSGFINLDHIKIKDALQLLQKYQRCIEQYSAMFDNIPIRSKLKLSRTNVKDAEHVRYDDKKKQLEYIKA